jgi:hypothetical protein
VLYPAGTEVTPALARPTWASQGVALCNPDGSPTEVVTVRDRKIPATLCNGSHVAVIKAFYLGETWSSLASSTVVIDGDSTLELDYNQLNFEVTSSICATK